MRELSSVSGYDEKLAELERELLEIDGLLSDFNRELADYVENMEYDEETFYQVEKRLDEVNHLKSKYGSTIPDVLLALEEKQERLMQLKDYDTYLAGLKEEIARTQKVLEKQSSEVSAMRKEAAERLTAAVTQALLDLNFLDVRFMMNFECMAEYTANGFDDAEFLISTNPRREENFRVSCSPSRRC